MNKHLLSLSIGAALLMAALPLAGQGRGGRGGAPVNIPDGPGKDNVQSFCANCHSLNMIVNSGGYTRDGWRALIATMVALPPDVSDTVSGYLATNFPEQPRPPAVLVDGPAKVSFKEWAVPTLGSRPHDPLATPDGALWYTGQFANRARPRRHEDRRDQGIRVADARVRPARLDRGQRRQHLVHRQLEGIHRQAESRDQPGHRIQTARGRPRSTYAVIR